MAEIKITKDNFMEEVASSDKPVLLDFWASWCGPCKMIAPILHEIAEENRNIKVGKVNVDEEFELAQSFRVASIPMLVLLKDGKPVKTMVGYRPKKEILDMLK